MAFLCAIFFSFFSHASESPWSYDPKTRVDSVYDLLELNWSMEQEGLFTIKVNQLDFIPQLSAIDQMYTDAKFRKVVMVVSGVHTNKEMGLVPLSRGTLLNMKIGKKELGLVFVGWSEPEIRDWQRSFLLKKKSAARAAKLPSRYAVLTLLGHSTRACANDLVRCELPLTAPGPQTMSQVTLKVQENETSMGLYRCSLLAGKSALNTAYLPIKMVEEGVEKVMKIGELFKGETWVSFWNSLTETGSNLKEFWNDIDNQISKSMRNFINIDPELYKILGCVVGGQLAAFAAIAATGVGAWRVAKEVGAVAFALEKMGPMLVMISNLIRQGKLAAADAVGIITKYLEGSKTAQTAMDLLASRGGQLAASAVKCTL